MIKVVKAFLFFCSLILLIALPGNLFHWYQEHIDPVSYAQDAVQLTTEERLWLDNHQPIRIAFDGNFPPYSFIDESGQLAGLAYDTLQLISQKLNMYFEIDKRTLWSEVYKAGLEGEIDVIATMVQRPEREDQFLFTQPYVFKSLVIITHKTNQQINHRSHLSRQTVALVKDYQYSQRILKDFPDITPFYVDSIQNALNAVETGQADAAISFLESSYYFQHKYLYRNIKVAAFYDRNSANESIAVRKDWPILVNIMQKGLDSLTDLEKQAIDNQWNPSVEVPADYKTIKQITFSLLIILFILLSWIAQIKHQHRRIKTTQNKLLKVNSELNQLKENLESEVLQRTQQLKISENKYRSLVENLQDEYFFYQQDVDGIYTYLSPSISNILGYRIEDFLQHYSCYQTDNSENIKATEYIKRCLNGEKVPAYEVQVFDCKGQKRWLELLETALYNEDGQCIGLEGIAHDVTLLKQARERLNWLSYYDELTGLANRRLLTDRLEQMIALSHRQQESMALLFLDLNRFKIVNDSLGHAAGDEVLKETASRLRAQLRNSDIAARIGGDEFTLLLPATDAEAAKIVAQKIMQCFVSPFSLNDQQFFLSTSIGIAIYPQDGNTSETLLQQADNAMYFAKKNNQGYAFCTTDLQQIGNHRLRLEQALRSALRQDNQEEDFELCIVYQSKHYLQTGQIQGYEALMRWHHPELGDIAPIEFIQIAEETGLIVELSRWVIKHTSLQAIKWTQEGFDFGKIAINISAIELINYDLAKNIIHQINTTEALAKWFEIEITESALMKTPDIAIKVMQELVDAGIFITIDDFGTGYSSLAYLKNIPASYIKIDQSFMRNILNSPEDQTVVRAVIAMSHALGKKVIAEGVETQEQVYFLTELGCDIAQGYCFSMPTPAAQITQHNSLSCD